MKNIFDKAVTEEMIGRLENLTPASSAKWGTMNVAQMLAHCNVTYEMMDKICSNLDTDSFKG